MTLTDKQFKDFHTPEATKKRWADRCMEREFNRRMDRVAKLQDKTAKAYIEIFDRDDNIGELTTFSGKVDHEYIQEFVDQICQKIETILKEG